MTAIKQLNSNKIKIDKEKCLLATSIIVSFISLFFFWKMCETISLVYIDDVMYADWTKHGISHFFERINWHWNEFNGRTFIHIVLSLILIFKEHLYAILMPLCVFVPSCLFYKIAKPKSKLYEQFFVGSIAIICFIALSPLFLSNTLIWMAGGINYIFPLLIVSTGYLLYSKSKENNKFIIPTVILLFLAGATTEQYGMFMIGLIVMSSIFDILDKKKDVLKKNIGFFITTACGYLTIFLSPGTSSRVSDHMVGLSGFIASFVENNEWLFSYDYLLTAIIMLLFGVLGVAKKYRILLLNIPIAILTFFLNASIENKLIVYLIFLLDMLFISLFFLLQKDMREYGKLVICGYGTFFMMSVVEAGFRTCVPFLITIYVVLTMLYIHLLIENKQKIKWIPAIVAVLFVFSCYFNYQDTYEGFKKTEQEYVKPLYNSLINANEKGKIELPFDYIDRTKSVSWFRYYSAIDLGKQEKMQDYASYFGYPEDIVYTHNSTGYDVYNISYDNKSYILPAIKQDDKIFICYKLLSCRGDGEINDFIPIPLIAPNNEKCVGYNLDDNNYFITSVTGNLLSVRNGETVCLKQNADYITIPTKTADEIFIEINAFCEWVDASYTFDNSTNTYYITSR